MRSLAILFVVAAALLPAGCHSEPTPEEKGRQAVVFYKEGVPQFNEGHIDQGIETLRKGYQLQPDYTLLRQDLARMLLVRAQRSELSSMNLSEEAKRLHSEDKHDEANAKFTESTSMLRNARADWSEAQGHLLYLQDATPYEANVPYWLSICETGLGHYSAAEADLKKAIELGQPTGPQLEKLQRAMELLRQAQLEEERLKKK